MKSSSRLLNIQFIIYIVIKSILVASIDVLNSSYVDDALAEKSGKKLIIYTATEPNGIFNQGGRLPISDYKAHEMNILSLEPLKSEKLPEIQNHIDELDELSKSRMGNEIKDDRSNFHLSFGTDENHPILESRTLHFKNILSTRIPDLPNDDSNEIFNYYSAGSVHNLNQQDAIGNFLFKTHNHLKEIGSDHYDPERNYAVHSGSGWNEDPRITAKYSVDESSYRGNEAMRLLNLIKEASLLNSFRRAFVPRHKPQLFNWLYGPSLHVKDWSKEKYPQEQYETLHSVVNPQQDNRIHYFGKKGGNFASPEIKLPRMPVYFQRRFRIFAKPLQRAEDDNGIEGGNNIQQQILPLSFMNFRTESKENTEGNSSVGHPSRKPVDWFRKSKNGSEPTKRQSPRVVDSDSFNYIANNKIYNKKLPPHLNVSWFVYMNCSREKCLLTNSTNETEWMDEGWVLHNCTSYGCTEIYPRSESLQKFIGLMLLVTSICVLKILAFVLIFYYCRRIKLTKNGDMPMDLTENEDSAKGPPKANHLDDIDPSSKPNQNDKQPKAEDISKSTDQQNRNITDAPSESLLNDDQAPNLEELNKSSKVWTPPNKTALPNASDGDELLVFGVHVEKAFHPSSSMCDRLRNRKADSNLLNRHSRIPTLVGRKSGKLGSETTKPQLKTETDELYTDGLLMQLDDYSFPVSNDKGLFPSAHLEKSPQWQRLPDNDQKSYISLDDDELSQFLARV